MKAFYRPAIRSVTVVAVLFALLFYPWSINRLSGFIMSLAVAAVQVISESKIQWIVFDCMGFYFGTFLWLNAGKRAPPVWAVSYTHLRAHETGRNLVCRLL